MQEVNGQDRSKSKRIAVMRRCGLQWIEQVQIWTRQDEIITSIRSSDANGLMWMNNGDDEVE
jgi:hypothetical protein